MKSASAGFVTGHAPFIALNAPGAALLTSVIALFAPSIAPDTLAIVLFAPAIALVTPGIALDASGNALVTCAIALVASVIVLRAVTDESIFLPAAKGAGKGGLKIVLSMSYKNYYECAIII